MIDEVIETPVVVEVDETPAEAEAEGTPAEAPAGEVAPAEDAPAA